MSKRDDDLAYGDPPRDRAAPSEGTDRSIVGDTFKFLKNKYQETQHPQPQQSFGYTEQPPAQGGYQGSYDPTSYHPSQGDQPAYPGGPPPQKPQATTKPDAVGSVLGALHGVVHGVGHGLAERFGTKFDGHSTGQTGSQATQAGGSVPSGTAVPAGTQNRYSSFSSERPGNDVKWYVDGCSYMYAVSLALEAAKESIWILDWWLTPELYLRRPPSKNEKYRVDRMLQAAAQRGVRVNIVVYKEVTQALTLCSSHTKHALEDLHPNIAVFRHPDHLPDAQNISSNLVSSIGNLKIDAANVSKLGLDALKGVYGINDDVILYWAHHEKLCLVDGKTAFMGGLDLCFGRWDTNQHEIADAHPYDINATIFPGQDYNNARVMDFQEVNRWDNNKLDRRVSSRMGWSDISISFHGPAVQDLRRHFIDRWNFIYDEKYNNRRDVRYSKFSPDGKAVFPSGGASNQQPQGAAQPSSQPVAVTGQGAPPQFAPPPGSSGGSASVSQFAPPPTSQYDTSAASQFPPPPASEFSQTQASNLPPQQSSSGPPQQEQYFPPPPPGPPPSNNQLSQTPPPGQYDSQPPHQYQAFPPEQQQHHEFSAELEGSAPHQPGQYRPYRPAQGEQSRGFDDEDPSAQSYDGERGFSSKYGNEGRRIKDEVKGIGKILYERSHSGSHHGSGSQGRTDSRLGAMPCQIVRSCSKWSSGTATEQSIQNAYISVIEKSQHFVYIENQFFITATGDLQKPVKNLIGKALVDRILRAARAGERYQVIVIIPSVPAFAGDLKDEGSLGTRAIMEFQYNSINRGGHSIMEMIEKEGINPMQYIRFYNLRNYDRINSGAVMQQAEIRSGVSFEEARKQHDDAVGAGYGGRGEGTSGPNAQYQQYQHAAQQVSQGKATGGGRWDSVAECSMLGGTDIRQVPWDSSTDSREIESFVSEELYVHTKVLIADDRTVICGSANINDRSQLGYHDSEIAIVIEDPTPVESSMAGKPWRASRFAASLRRFLFRKHLGLVRPQDPQRPDENFEPVGTPNRYDWNTPEDRLVADPLADTFQNLWNSRARTNTEVFRKVFHAVPDDQVRNWNDYKEFYEYYFHKLGEVGKETPAKFQWGHVVTDGFAQGEQGLQEVKEQLSKVKGSLVEMPLMFLIEEDIAKEGTSLNAFTQQLYT